MSSKAGQKPPFSLEKLEISPSTGEIAYGTALLDGISKPVTLRNVATSQDSKDLYSGEKYFKLEFDSTADDDIEATIEGSFINKPYHTQLTGKFRRTFPDGKNVKEIETGFTIVKRVFATLIFQYAKEVEQEFDVEISAGQVSD